MNVRVYTLDVHLEVRFQISRAVRTEKRMVIVELEEEGRVARGEGSPDAFFGETTESIEAEVRSALALLPDEPSDLDALKRCLDGRFTHGGVARCRLDILAHGCAAYAERVPVRSFLGLIGPLR